MKHMKLIFGGKVLNYERHLTYFHFLVYRKIIENNLEDLNNTCVTKLVQKQTKKFGWMKNYFLCLLPRFFLYIIQILDVGALWG